MKKILATLAALAVAGAMATSAFAATTLTGYEEYEGDWQGATFVDSEGTLINFVSTDYLEEYLDTGCSITLEFSYHTLAGQYFNRYMVAPGNANGWEKLYATDNSYVEGVPSPEMGLTDPTDENSQKKYDDGTYAAQYYFKPDGFLQLNPEADGTWVRDTLTFNISGECIQYLIDTRAENDDGSLWGGLIFQLYGMNISSLTIDAPVDFDENAGMNADPNAGAGEEDTGSDDNVQTGAEAGLALAGIALAGAAVVATKKNK